MMIWKPIESAPPTDHMNQILLAWKYRAVSTGWWDVDEDYSERPIWWPSPEEGWRGEGDNCIPVEDGWPTHWMPLPEPPIPEPQLQHYTPGDGGQRDD